ncbi:hypothetical protein ACOMHN_018099 [Nucella lapillus]
MLSAVRNAARSFPQPTDTEMDVDIASASPQPSTPPPSPAAAQESSFVVPVEEEEPSLLDEPVQAVAMVTAELTFEVIPRATTRGRPLLVDSDGYAYGIHRERRGVTHWRCTRRGKDFKCQAMVRQEGDVFSHGIHEHAHASDTGTATKAKLVRDVKEEALVNPFQSAYTIAECLNPQSSGGREKQQRTPPGGCSSSGTSSSPGKEIHRGRVCCQVRNASQPISSPGYFLRPGVIAPCVVQSKHTLPDLPYDYNALEPYISADIMMLHHQKHHATYVNNLNVAEEKLAEAMAKNDVQAVISLQPALKFNGGGHINHSIFWEVLDPQGGGDPDGDLKAQICQDYGSVENMKKELTAATVAVQGSGWGWLGYNPLSGRLRIATCANQDPLQATAGLVPLFGIDVWEHAYYLQYKNVRPDYVKAIYNIVNWKSVAKRFAEAKMAN